MIRGFWVHLRIEWVEWRKATCCNWQLLPAPVIGRSRAVFWVDNINERCKHSSTTSTTPSPRSKSTSTREWCTGWTPITHPWQWEKPTHIFESTTQPGARETQKNTQLKFNLLSWVDAGQSRYHFFVPCTLELKVDSSTPKHTTPHPRISLNHLSNNLH